MIWQPDYHLESFLQSVVFREKDRCRYCYHARLYATAKLAKKGKFDAFSSTLLYSRYQNHVLMQEIGAAVAKQTGVNFSTMISEKAGNRVLMNQRPWVCTGSPTAAVSTVKKTGTSSLQSITHSLIARDRDQDSSRRMFFPVVLVFNWVRIF
jgi:hypothetical protein